MHGRAPQGENSRDGRSSGPRRGPGRVPRPPSAHRRRARGNAAVAADGGGVDVRSPSTSSSRSRRRTPTSRPCAARIPGRPRSSPSCAGAITCALSASCLSRAGASGRDRSRPSLRRCGDSPARATARWRCWDRTSARTPDGARPSPSVRAGDDAFDRYYADGFRGVYKPRRDGAVRFAELLDAAADVNPEMRVRFRRRTERFSRRGVPRHRRSTQRREAAAHARAERFDVRVGAHATRVHAGGVRCVGEARARGDSGRGAVERFHRRIFLRRDGRGTRGHGGVDARDEVRTRLHVRVFDAREDGGGAEA